MVTLEPRHMEMAKAIAASVTRRLPRNVLKADVVQAAMMGLLDAVRRDPTGEGPAYDWYLRCRIRGEIFDELRRQSFAGRRRPGAPVATVLHLEDYNDQWQDAVAGKTEDPEATAITRIDAAKAWQTAQKARDVRVMRAVFEGGRRHRDVGDDEGVSEARISQVVTISLMRMRAHLTGEAEQHPLPRSRRAGNR